MSPLSDMNNNPTNDDLVWRALSDARRRQMLDRLAKGPATTGELVADFAPLCRTAVMKHLDVLEAAGLLIVRLDGRMRWNHLNPVPIEDIPQRWIENRQQRMGAALNRLKSIVEEPERTKK
ncbi:MAG: DNA-binding transcriptional ArsR family regulator [Candidatus Krumholzibacteriia bacterium]|jgi:DNA-binding transcriptional ArsR family regulator